MHMYSTCMRIVDDSQCSNNSKYMYMMYVYEVINNIG